MKPRELLHISIENQNQSEIKMEPADAKEQEALEDKILEKIQAAINVTELGKAYDRAKKYALLEREKTARTFYNALISKAFDLKILPLCYHYFKEAREKKILTSAMCEMMLQVVILYKDIRPLNVLYDLITKNNLGTPLIYLRAIYAFIRLGDIETALFIYASQSVATSLKSATLIQHGVHTDNIHISILYLLLNPKTDKSSNYIRSIAMRTYERLLESEPDAPFHHDKIHALMLEIAKVYHFPKTTAELYWNNASAHKKLSELTTVERLKLRRTIIAYNGFFEKPLSPLPLLQQNVFTLVSVPAQRPGGITQKKLR